jgi:type II secretory ATPase GspE/PulE/Tfp pilus assembly ATPase PilB-like protein/CheY-like chemotaxis protein
MKIPEFDPLSGSASTLREAVRRVYAERADVAALEFDGPEPQGWSAYARMLDVRPEELARAIAPAFGVEAAGPINGLAIEAAVLEQVPYNLCQKHTVLPLRWSEGVLVVATGRPDQDLRERLAFLVGKPVRWALAPPAAIEDALLVAFSREAVRAAASGSADAAGLDENAIVKLGRELATRAIRLRASDLHIQPYLGQAVARIRVDGVMRRLAILPEAVAGMLIRHVKARGGMDPSNTQVPQDGRMSFVLDGRDYELRLSTLPATRGERLVIRFLSQGQVHRLGSAGFSLAALQTLRRAVARPAGLVVFTGPTGSGKTSTLYGMLSEVNRSDVNIITVENPVEYRVAGISQVDVNEKAGRTFAAALRSILRQDPDVILVGEIRDRETAEIAVQAAMTGHLVLTTLHTNDAMTAIPRLLDLGVQPSVLADALVVVASQRLCRKLCAACRMPVAEPLSPEERAFQDLTRNAPAYRAVGCQQCEFTGFRGRLPIVDIVEINRALRDAIAAGESRLAVLEGLREGGLKSLAASGSLRVISGDTTVREVMDAVGPAFWSELAAHYGAYFSTEVAEAIPTNAAKGFGVLLVGGDDKLAESLKRLFDEEGLRIVEASDAQSADRLLHDDEDIAFIVRDLPEGSGLDEALAVLREHRLHTAWARLPSAVLLPPSLAAHQEALRSSGSMAAMLVKPLDVAELLAQVRRSQAR